MNDGVTTETIEFRAVAPTPKLAGLDMAIRKLESLDSLIRSVQGRLSGLSTNTAFKLSATQFAARVPTKGAQDVRKLARSLGFPDVKDVAAAAKQVEAELQKQVASLRSKLDKTPVSASGSSRARDNLRKQIRQVQEQSFFTDPTASTLRNPTRAGAFFEQYARSALQNRINAEKAIVALLGGSASGGGGVAGGKIGGVELGPGKISLIVPADRIEAKLGAGNIIVSGQANASTAEKKAVAAAAAAAAPKGTPMEGAFASEKVTTYPGGSKAKVTQRKFITGIDETVDVYLKDLNDEFKRVTTRSPAKRRLSEIKDQLLGVQNEVRSFGTSATVRKDPRAAAAFFTKQSAQLGSFIPEKAQGELMQLGLGNWIGKIQALSATLQGRAKAATDYAAGREAKQREDDARKEQQRRMGNAKSIARFENAGDKQRAYIQRQQAKVADMERDAAQKKILVAASRAATEQAVNDFKAQGGRMVAQYGPVGGKPNKIVMMRDDGQFQHTLTANYGAQGGSASVSSKMREDRLDKALQGMSVRNMAANVLKVTEWAAAVTVLYKSVELAEYSLKRLEETGMQMAHLSIVFRGVGGDVKTLTNDMIRLAAAQGRGTQETMESATEWARLGGDRATINKEVEVSALAANIANMHMGETTKQLMSLMHIYHLEADGLNGTLGMLVNTSLKYNVTLEEMFTGLDRSAAAARVAGVPLAELQAMLGVVVGATGQTGSMTGNSLKYIFQELNKPEVQRQLRGFGIESLGNNLEQKPAGQLLGELSGIWGTLGQRSKQQLSGLLGGRFNAARVPVVLEEYPKILKLAIDAQLNLNKAQEANIKILDTLKAQLAGMKSQYDRIVLSAGGMRLLTTAASLGKNVLSDVADRAESHGLSDEQIQTAKQDQMRAMYTKPDGWLQQKIWAASGLSKLATQVFPATAARVTGIQSLLGMAPENSALGIPAWLYKQLKQTPGVVDLYNYRHQQAGVAGGDEYESSLAGLRQGMGVNGLRSREFGIGLTQLRNGTMSAENANIMAEVMEKMTGGRGMASSFLNAFQGGNRQGSIDIMQGAQRQSFLEMTQQQGDAAALAAQRANDLQGQHDALTASIADAIKLGKAHDDLDNQLKPVDEAMQKAQQDTQDLGAAYAELAGEIDVVREAQEKYGALMKTQEALMDQMDKLFTGTPAVTPGDALTQEAAALQGQVNEMLAAQKAFDQMHSGSRRPEDQGVDVYFNDQIKALEAKLDAANNPARRSMASALTQQQFGRQRAEVEAGSSRFGIDDTVKLLNERRHLEGEMNSLSENGMRTMEEQGRLSMDIVLHQQNSLAIRQRAADVEREIHQLAIDQNKEFSRSFFAAGPAEMLRKLAAFRMTFDTKGNRRPDSGQGGFFSMGPEMRGEFGQLNTQYNPAMIELKREQSELAAFLKSLNLQDFGPQFDKVITDMGKNMEGVFATLGKDLLASLPTESLSAARDAMDTLSGAAIRAASHLNDLADGPPLSDWLANLTGYLAGSLGQGGVFKSALVPVLPQGGGVGGARSFVTK